jgi:hypothetical protein
LFGRYSIQHQAVDSPPSSKIDWQEGGTTSTTQTTLLDPTSNKSTSLSPTSDKSFSVSNNDNDKTHAVDPIKQRTSTTPSQGKSFYLSENTSVAMYWWEPYVDAISQPFHPWNGTKWCYDEKAKEGQTTRHGLMLSKVHKAGSTTAAGVTLRAAHRVAKRLEHAEPCLSYLEHKWSLNNGHSFRDPLKSFFGRRYGSHIPEQTLPFSILMTKQKLIWNILIQQWETNYAICEDETNQRLKLARQCMMEVGTEELLVWKIRL